MLLGELIQGPLARAVQGNPFRTLFCARAATTLRGNSFHVASFSPTIRIGKMYPA
jgi:hypothetical protein